MNNVRRALSGIDRKLPMGSFFKLSKDQVLRGVALVVVVTGVGSGGVR